MTARVHDNPEPRQLERVRALIEALIPDNRFYAPVLEAAGIGPDIESVAAFRRRMPLTDRGRLIEDQAAHPPYGTNLTYPLPRYTRSGRSSPQTSLSRQ